MKEVIRLDRIRRDFVVGDEVVHALRGISLTITEGEFVTIMGTSGSGKSTLLNTLGCLDTPTSGEYYLDGIAVRSMDKNARATLRNRKIGFVFQNYNLLPKTTALENVELPLMYNSTYSAAQRRERAEQALRNVGLGDRMLHKSNQMSGGQMQRVAIARALVNDPAVILADEATGNLDTRTSFEILVLFQRLHAEGRTIIFVTHNPEIAAMADRVIRIEDGRMNLSISTELVSEVFEEALRHTNRHSGQHTITVQMDDDLLLAHMDAKLVVQVLINLVDNAIKYTPAGSHIVLSAAAQGESAVIRVSDDGPGIPDEAKEKVFEMFSTGEKRISDSRRSLGLGLALCRTIIAAHGGTITLSDNTPHGCIFTFTLPLGEVSLHE